MSETINVHWVFVKERAVFVMGFLDRENRIQGFEEVRQKPDEPIEDTYKRMREVAEQWCSLRDLEAVGLDAPMSLQRSQFCRH